MDCNGSMRFQVTRVVATVVGSVLVGGSVLLAGACGKSGNNASETVAAETFVTNQFPTSIAPATTTAAPSTVAPTTVAPISTTTLDPVEADRVAIKALIDAVDEEVLVLLNADPPDFSKLQAMGEPNSLAVASITAFVKKFQLEVIQP